MPEVVHDCFVLVLELLILLLLLYKVVIKDLVPEQLVPAQSFVFVYFDTFQDEVLCNWRDLLRERDLFCLNVPDQLVLRIPEPWGPTKQHLNGGTLTS